MPVFRLQKRSLVFPPASLADDSYGGLLAVGGDYRAERLVEAYSHGIFPWPEPSVTDEIAWFSPTPRFVLLPGNLHVPKSLARVMKSRKFEITVDKAFCKVIRACATVPRPGQDGTWITDDLIAGYETLHRRGYAHSVEAWFQGELAGGFYGVSLGTCFFGESMFAKVADASKCAFATYATRLFADGCPFIDCQVHTEHLARFGAVEIPRGDYLDMLAKALGNAQPAI